ncbi:MAG: transposase [Tissierellia bacterium]|nr:transposase [Tissierellia bacterium]
MEGEFITSRIRQRYDEVFKRNAEILSYATSKTMKDLVTDLGIHASLIYNWRRTYTEEETKLSLLSKKALFENFSLKMQNEKWKTKC